MSMLEAAEQGRDTPRAFLGLAMLAQRALQRVDVPEVPNMHSVPAQASCCISECQV